MGDYQDDMDCAAGCDGGPMRPPRPFDKKPEELEEETSPLVNWQIMAKQLWQLLDDVDTASDMIKPSSEEGYKAFYRYTMKKVAERHKRMHSPDGLRLVPTKAKKDDNG